MDRPVIIVWFRQDLRLADNPALSDAAARGAVLPVYILEDENAGEWKMGGASRVWLHHALAALDKSLSGRLHLCRGDAGQIIPGLAKKTGAKTVVWNRCYEPWRIARDKGIKAALEKSGVEVRSFNGSLLWEPWDVLKDDGTPYKVFTPFYRKGCLSRPEPRPPLPAPELAFADTPSGGLALSDMNLLPKLPWHKSIESEWTPGEAGAQARLADFLDGELQGYKEGRNYPARDNVSRLSPHLHFGHVSPNQAWHAVKIRAAAEGLESDADCFLSELGWREFSYSLLYHNPALPERNLQGRFDAFPWNENGDLLERWRRGRTGYPVVDAAMRELWTTGYMHNRARMIVGSFLVKHLLLDWRQGERWFWDCLVDADLANNAASWQWIAGCGADAAPYFRIFNPVTQGEKFDPEGDYVRRWVPELATLPANLIHRPWEADVPPANYPAPAVDHGEARRRALEAFAKTKSASNIGA